MVPPFASQDIIIIWWLREAGQPSNFILPTWSAQLLITEPLYLCAYAAVPSGITTDAATSAVNNKRFMMVSPQWNRRPGPLSIGDVFIGFLPQLGIYASPADTSSARAACLPCWAGACRKAVFKLPQRAL
jgi:hypothetical protein